MNPIIWINGPFGVGKTQTALALHARVPQSFVFDPEEVGYFIRKVTPPESHFLDFQDDPLWREMLSQTVMHALERSKGPLIVPMTLVHPTYFKEIMASLAQEDIVVHHIALIASKEKLLHRLKTRGDDQQSWPAKQIERCLQGLHQMNHLEHIATDHLALKDVVEQILKRFEIELS